jgi:hypothetical protein
MMDCAISLTSFHPIYQGERGKKGHGFKNFLKKIKGVRKWPMLTTDSVNFVAKIPTHLYCKNSAASMRRQPRGNKFSAKSGFRKVSSLKKLDFIIERKETSLPRYNTHRGLHAFLSKCLSIVKTLFQ